MNPPRPGGEADKVGNRFELVWAAWNLLQLGPTSEVSITFEDPDPDLALGSELTLMRPDANEVHQLKRRSPSGSSWSVRSLQAAGVLKAVLHHASQNRTFTFVSQSPADTLYELAERARSASSLKAFVEYFQSVKSRGYFDELSAGEVWGDAERAWRTLQRLQVQIVSEHFVRTSSVRIAEVIYEGASGSAIVDSLAGIVLQGLGRTISSRELHELLAAQGIRRVESGDCAESQTEVAGATQSWLRSVQRTMLTPRISRSETEAVLTALSTHSLVVLHGSAGSGKSGVLSQVVTELCANDCTVLAFRLDRLGSIASARTMGQAVGLERDPIVGLRRAAMGGPAVLIIDQLDAVSLVSGRVPESADAVWDVIEAALATGMTKVIVACRTFDLENDARLRALLDPTAANEKSMAVEVEAHPTEAVSAALSVMQVDYRSLSATQIELLSSPLHLALLQGSRRSGQGGLPLSRLALFDAFWQEKQRSSRVRLPAVRFTDALCSAAELISARKSLTVPFDLLDTQGLAADVDVLISERVLERQGRHIAFFHESFFDYVFARAWMSRAETLTDFLRGDEQDLFRRAQVRQILAHLALSDSRRHRDEAEAVLQDPATRFHMQLAVVGAFSQHPDPSSSDLSMLLRAAASRPKTAEHIWDALAQPKWIALLLKSGTIATWLDATNTALGARAVQILRGANVDQMTAIASLLDDRIGHPASASWIEALSRPALTGESRALFELLLRAIRRGDFGPHPGDLWIFANDLCEAQPDWAMDLLESHFVRRVAALSLDDSGQVPALLVSDHFAPGLIDEIASARPLRFVKVFVPFALDVMAATQTVAAPEHPISHGHFDAGFQESDHRERADHVLFHALSEALKTVARRDPGAIQHELQALADSPFEGAHFLLCSALAAAGSHFAKWAVDLLDSDAHLAHGYRSDPTSATRELITAISPLVTPEEHLRLERRFMVVRPTYERRDGFGYTAFTLLACLNEERLSPLGRRTLQEFRRKFNIDRPAEPRGVIAGWVGPPIDSDRAAHMTDGNWIRAMVKHSGEGRRDNFLIGGAHELAQVLRSKAEQDPARYAALAVRLQPGIHGSYLSALLYAFGSSEALESHQGAVFDAIRHIATIGGVEVDRALAFSVQRLLRHVPLDIVELLLDRALAAAPVDDSKPPVTQLGSDDLEIDDLFTNGLNTVRGGLIAALSDLLLTDVDGARTARVSRHLTEFASDRSVIVQTCVARLIGACLRHDRPAAEAAFVTLAQDDLTALATRDGTRLMMYLGNATPDLVVPTIDRMMAANQAAILSAAGRLVAHAGLMWNETARLESALHGSAALRLGVAEICVSRLEPAAPHPLLVQTLMVLMQDPDTDVQKAVARLPYELSTAAIDQHGDLVRSYIASPCFTRSAAAMLHVLDESAAPIGGLALLLAERMIAEADVRMADVRTSYAGDAWQLSELLVKALSQADDPATRAGLLDALDRLLELNAFGVEGIIREAERGTGYDNLGSEAPVRRRRQRRTRGA